MGVQRFENLIAWQKAQDVAVMTYEQFGSSRDFGFRDQIQRAAVSISNNIAEGFDRGSTAHFKRFLFYAIGSCSEVRSMLYLAERLGTIGLQQQSTLITQTFEVSRIIRGLI